MATSTLTRPAAQLASADAAAPLEMFRTHARRFQYLSWAALLVSFAHQSSSLLLFSGPGWLDWSAGYAMTAIVDLALWMLGEYLYEARLARRRVFWPFATFLLATVVSIGLNYTYLYVNRPKAEALDGNLSVAIAAVFALFVPLLIAVCGLVRAELARWQIDAAAEARSLASVTEEARQARARVAELEAQLVDQQARMERAVEAGTEQTRRHTATEQAAATARAQIAEQARRIAELEREITAARAQITEVHGGSTAIQQRATALAQENTALTQRATAAERQIAELEREITAAERRSTEWQQAATALPTRTTVAERLRAAIDAGTTVAELARLTGWPQSTLRDMTAAAA